MRYREVEQLLLDLYFDKENLTNKEEKYFEYIQKLRRLAYRNIAEAQYDLAGHYDDLSYLGYPNPFYSAKKKYYWFKKSAENGYPEAYNNLASMYENGEYVFKNISKALELYKKGGELGSKNALENYYVLKKQIK